MVVVNFLQGISILFAAIILIYFSLYLFLVVFSKLFSVMVVQAKSMEPSLKSGDRILIINHVYQFYLKRGQIVILSLPESIYNPLIGKGVTHLERSILVKRLVGLAGDQYIAQSSSVEFIPDGQVYVLGDNPVSWDSRDWGPIPLNSIQGIVIARIGRGKQSVHSPLQNVCFDEDAIENYSSQS